jgi:hypothetical protein
MQISGHRYQKIFEIFEKKEIPLTQEGVDVFSVSCTHVPSEGELQDLVRSYIGDSQLRISEEKGSNRWIFTIASEDSQGVAKTNATASKRIPREEESTSEMVGIRIEQMRKCFKRQQRAPTLLHRFFLKDCLVEPDQGLNGACVSGLFQAIEFLAAPEAAIERREILGGVVGLGFDRFLEEAFEGKEVEKKVWIAFGAEEGYIPRAEFRQSLVNIQGKKIYGVDIEDVCLSLSILREKIGLFFALNLFDAMTPLKRGEVIAKLSANQEVGGLLLILLDKHPQLSYILNYLYLKFDPIRYLILPYLLTNIFEPIKAIIIPREKSCKCFPYSYSEDIIDRTERIFIKEIHQARQGLSLLQYKIKNYIEKEPTDFNLISLEDLFAEEISETLRLHGYSKIAERSVWARSKISSSQNEPSDRRFLYSRPTNRVMAPLQTSHEEMNALFTSRGMKWDFSPTAAFEQQLKEAQQQMAISEVWGIIAEKN